MLNLASRRHQDLFIYFINNPQRSHHLRELAEIMEVDPGNLSRVMVPLVGMGLFETSEKGRLKFFSINTKHPLYKDIKSIILKTAGVPMLLKEALQRVKGIEKAFVYGSVAADSSDAQSDLDLMVVGVISVSQLVAMLKPLEKKLGREIHYRILDKTEYDKRLSQKDPFLLTVLGSETISIIDNV